MTQRTRSANLGGTVITSTGVVLASGLDVSSQSNAAYAQANTARDTANSAFNHANNAFDHANSAFAHANTIFDQANAAYLQANTARSDSNTTFATVNSTFATVNTAVTNAHNQANTATTIGQNAYGQANLAYAAANNSNLLSGGLVSGTINVTQDLIVGGNIYLEGNTTYINVSTYSIEDSLVYYASNNKLTDSVDIGFMGGKNTSGTYSHTGLARDATDGKWKLFDGLAEEGHVGNVVDFANTTIATLVANVEASSVSIGTTNPEGPLHVKSTSAYPAYIFEAANTAIYAGPYLNLRNPSLSSNFGETSIQHTLLDPNDLTNVVFQIQQRTTNSSFVRQILQYDYKNQNWQFFTNGSEKMRITSGGNVGIGASSPGHKLEVSGSLYHRDAYASLGGYNSGGQNTPFNRYGATFGTNITGGQAEVNIWNPTDPATYTSTGILFSQALSATTRRDLMFLKHDGLVGIGTNSPNSPLHIVTTNNVAPILRMETTGNSTNTAFWIEDQDADPAAKAIATMDLSAGLGLFNLYAGAYTVGATNYYGSTRGASRIGLHDNIINFFTANTNAAGHSTGTAVTWYQTLSSSNASFIVYTNNGTERLRVSETGNVGIGAITTPSTILALPTTTSRLSWGTPAGAYTLNSSGGGALLFGVNGDSEYFAIETHLSGTGHAERFRITEAGNVGIGTSSPTNRLSISGTCNATGDFRAPIFYDSDDTSGYFDGAGALVMRGGSPTIYFRDTDHNSAMLHCNGNLLYVLRGATDTTSWSQVNGQWPFIFYLGNNDALCGGSFSAVGNVTAYSSDRRLKTNIKKIPNALDKVLSLNGVTFDWIDRVKELGFTPDTMINDAGVIAQEVQEVLPQAVKPAPFDYQWDNDKNANISRSGENFITVQYEKIVPLLIEAIKELKAEIDTLKQRG